MFKRVINKVWELLSSFALISALASAITFFAVLSSWR